jgi:hypothetical protein
MCSPVLPTAKITVENRTAIPIYALLTWAGGHIDGTGVVGGHTLAKKQARGSTSWIFEGTKEHGYRLVEQ